jgi:hypothetical protein
VDQQEKVFQVSTRLLSAAVSTWGPELRSLLIHSVVLVEICRSMELEGICRSFTNQILAPN